MGEIVELSDYRKRKKAETALKERYGKDLEELTDDMVRELDDKADALTKEGNDASI